MRNQLSRRRFLTIAAASTIFSAGPTCAALAEAARDVPLRRWYGTTLGAKAEILLYHPDTAEADRLVLACLEEIARLEKIFSLYRKDSTLVALNNRGELRDPPLDLVILLARSQQFGALTDGAFDVSVQPLWNLYWNHFIQPNANPDGPCSDAIVAARNLVDYRDIHVAPDRIALSRPGMAVTLNGIAQGYITDCVTQLLAENGLEHVLVHLDETRALGPRADGTPWKVGIEDPVQPGRAIKTIELADRAVGTSGAYGTKFDAAGRFNHIFDPKTGRCSDRYLSVSVVAGNATVTDGLSTAFSIMPIDQVRACVNSLKSISVYFVLRDGNIVNVTE